MACLTGVALFLMGALILLVSAATLFSHPWFRTIAHDDPDPDRRRLWTTSTKLAAGAGLVIGLALAYLGVVATLSPCR
jgi:hypothetical protein